MNLIKIVSKAGWLIDLILFCGLFYFTVFPITVGGECNALQPDCGEDSYCGLDNHCYQFPFKDVVEEKLETEHQRLIVVPLLISVALVGGAYWYRRQDKKHNES